ncbi:SDR family oxidoreductase [Salisaeta longa]|uniref:SDR family oxidoreductase n=1 Tax=Salisaeta longa TaxID=503170 RepID=UPI0003B5AD83|nr:NAD(P)-dependent oxidoreductase [Salisaeta longa]
MLYERVLITGANGLVGQALVRRLSREPTFDVLATARDDALRVPGVSCGYAPLDVTNQAAIDDLFAAFTPTVVVHCAAITQVGVCAEQRTDCWATNATAVADLADACRRHGARMVHLSTDFVFDGARGPYDETARPDPVNYYGRSKLAGENALRDAGFSQWSIARTVLVYGTGHALSRANIALWVVQQLRAGETLHVVTDQLRTPTYVEDLALGIERIIRREATGVYHLSGPEMASVYAFAVAVAETFGLDTSRVVPVESDFFDAAPRPPRTGFVIEKARRELGYRPLAIRDGLQALKRVLDLDAAL